jgi:folate-binding Fe-S cluster repair protein YgfZ
VIIDRSHRPVLQLTGNDRRTWLHTISSQHVSELPDGAVVENLSLDGQGRVEDHWIQTELDGVTVIDTEPWRFEPLLTYLRKMVFWADVVIEPADLAVLSLLGPGIRDQAVLAALGVDALPARATAVPLAGGGFIRTMGSDEVDLLVPRETAADWHAKLVTAGVRPAGVWAYEAHRVAALRPRLGVDTDERTIPHEVGWIGGPGEGAVHLDKGCYRGRKPWPGSTTWANRPACWSFCTWTAGRPPGHRRPVLAAGVRSAASAPSSTTSTSARLRSRCSNAACPPTSN